MRKIALGSTKLGDSVLVGAFLLCVHPSRLTWAGEMERLTDREQSRERKINGRIDGQIHKWQVDKGDKETLFIALRPL